MFRVAFIIRLYVYYLLLHNITIINLVKQEYGKNHPLGMAGGFGVIEPTILFTLLNFPIFSFSFHNCVSLCLLEFYDKTD